MRKHEVIKILSLLFIFAVKSFTVNAESNIIQKGIEVEKTDTIDPRSSTPNSELEGLYFQIIPGGHTGVQKSFGNIHFSPFNKYNSIISSENIQIKRSSLFVKIYLDHIYPFHNFW